MTPSHPAVGSLAMMMGIGMILPVVAAWFETGGLTRLGMGIVAFGCFLIAGGVITLVVTPWRGRMAKMPSAVRAVVAANVLILAFLALEMSDRLVRQDGKIIYWTTFLLPPALLLFYGLSTARSWSWWAARVVAALGVLWFLGFMAVIPFAHLQADGVPVPWEGRVYMASLTLVFAGILAGAFWSLGRPETRTYFGLV